MQGERHNLGSKREEAMGSSNQENMFHAGIRSLKVGNAGSILIFSITINRGSCNSYYFVSADC